MDEIKSNINEALKNMSQYFHYLNLEISSDKSKVVVFGEIDFDLEIFYDNVELPIVNEFKYLGVIFSANLTWNKYVDYILGKANKAYNFIKSVSVHADPKILLMLYKSLVRSHFEYGFLCFGSDQRLIRKLDVLQNHNLRCITGAIKTTPINSLQVECNVPPLKIRFQYLKSKFLLKLLSFNKHPLYRKLSFYHTVYNPSNNINIPYLLHDFSTTITLNQQHELYKCNDTWTCYSGKYNSKFIVMNIVIKHDLKTKEEVYQLLHEHSGYRCIFTDASKSSTNVAMAIYIPYNKTGHGVRLPDVLTIFSAEAMAISAALDFISEENSGIISWLIVTDSMSVLMALDNNKLDASTNYIIYRIKEKYFTLQSRGFDIKFLWTPSHIGVSGNENADILARTIVDLGNTEIKRVAIPCSDLLPKIKEDNIRCWLEDWLETLQIKGTWYAKINTAIGSAPWFTKAQFHRSKLFYSLLCRLRFGHGRFNAHLARMKIIASPKCTDCNLDKDQTLNHIIFECPAHNVNRIILIDKLLEIYKTPANLPRDIQGLLENFSSYFPLFNFITSSGCKI